MPRLLSGIKSKKNADKFCEDNKGKNPLSGFSGLQGKLGLEEIINDGLISLNVASPYNIYDSSGPKNFGDDFYGNRESIERAAPSSPSKISGVGGSSQSMNSSFSSKIDFNVVWGINGGYNWTLLKFKGPSGGGSSGGGGGGGGGASASGSSGGASSGGGGQLINLTRTALDTLVITLTPSCRSSSNASSPVIVLESDSLPSLKWSFTSLQKQGDQCSTYKYSATIGSKFKGTPNKNTTFSLQPDGEVNYVEISKNEGCTCPHKVNTVSEAIQWDDYISKNRLTMIGTITDPISKNVLGVITVVKDNSDWQPWQKAEDDANEDAKKIANDYAEKKVAADAKTNPKMTDTDKHKEFMETYQQETQETYPKELEQHLGRALLSVLREDDKSPNYVTMSDALYEALDGSINGTPTASFWQALPICEQNIATAGQNVGPSAVQYAINQNLLMRFPIGLRRLIER